MKYIIGAYAIAPSSVAWDKEQETKFYQQLKALTNIQGLEHPFVGQLHTHDDNWFLENIDPNWQFVFTSIPGVMGNLSKNPRFGIASTDDKGRSAAINFYQQALQAITKLNKHLNKQAVSHIKIHTAPTITADSQSSVEALKSSLAILQSWDWQGTKLIIEHCDAYIKGKTPQKGFMLLADEIKAIKEVNGEHGCDIGLSINWGRSAIETCSTEGPLQHTKQAYLSGLLKGVIFSGASDLESPYGQWKDSHMPHEQALNVPSYAKGSLLTANEMKRTLEQCSVKQLDFIGGKIAIRPNDVDLDERISYITSLITLFDSVTKQEEK